MIPSATCLHLHWWISTTMIVDLHKSNSGWDGIMEIHNSIARMIKDKLSWYRFFVIHSQWRSTFPLIKIHEWIVFCTNHIWLRTYFNEEVNWKHVRSCQASMVCCGESWLAIHQHNFLYDMYAYLMPFPSCHALLREAYITWRPYCHLPIHHDNENIRAKHNNLHSQLTHLLFHHYNATPCHVVPSEWQKRTCVLNVLDIIWKPVSFGLFSFSVSNK